MANIREIKTRINSIKETMKITNAMYLMSSMKLRKARQQREDTAPYFYGLQKQITEILCHFPDMQHLYFDNREKDKMEIIKKKGFIIITSDKGMAGAYNHNVIKEAESRIQGAEDLHLYVVGEVGRHYFRNEQYPVDETFLFSVNNPSIHRARVMTERIVNLYKQEELDEVYIVYTRMINSMRQEVTFEQLLPLRTHQFIKQDMIDKAGVGIYADGELEHADDWFLIYPSPKKVLERVVYNYITGYLYGALVESSASEENARMVAMQAATDNALAMLSELSIQYNRIRQAAITQEITEVIGGAKALKKKKKKRKVSVGNNVK